MKVAIPEIKLCPFCGVYEDSSDIPSETTEPGFKRVREISFSHGRCGRCVRFLVLMIIRGEVSDSDLIKMAEMEVKALTKKQKINAIAICFARSWKEAARGISVAEIEWAPGGVWWDADTVRAGDYSRHQYVVTFNDT